MIVNNCSKDTSYNYNLSWEQIKEEEGVYVVNIEYPSYFIVIGKGDLALVLYYSEDNLSPAVDVWKGSYFAKIDKTVYFQIT